MLSNLHSWISWTKYASKLKWLEIKPEFDPCRYNSFPKNAGYQVFKLTEENRRHIHELSEEQRRRMPVLSCFASAVDATVDVGDIVWLFAELGNQQSELVLFDVNHFPVGDAYSTIEDRGAEGSVLFAKDDYLVDLVGRFGELTKESDTKARITWVTNRENRDSKGTPYEYSWSPESESESYRELGGAEPIAEKPIPQTWPRDAFALSHTCIPIATDDLFYGESSILHQLQPKGERLVLAVSMNDVTRLKFNPFFEYMKGKFDKMIDVE